MNYLCITIDGLHSGMIGAYGNSWIQTPALDAFAVQSVLFDRFYAGTPNIFVTLNDFRQLRNLLNAENYRKIFFTDDADVFRQELIDGFDEAERLESIQRKQPAETIEDTQFFCNTAAAADLLWEHRRSPFFLWGHFQGFYGNWDFPAPYRKMYQAEEDPVPYPGTAVPDFCNDNSDGHSDNNLDADVIQAVMETYSGGMTVLDETLAGLLEALKRFGLEKDTVVLFSSVRGFALGEHGKIGINDDLYSENMQIPLLIRPPCRSATQESRRLIAALAGFRSRSLLLPRDLLPLLTTALHTPEELPEEPAAVRPHLCIGDTCAGESAILTPDWFLYRKRPGGELYVKPDDRWETNDVFDRCPHVAEMLADKGDRH